MRWWCWRYGNVRELKCIGSVNIAWRVVLVYAPNLSHSVRADSIGKLRKRGCDSHVHIYVSQDHLSANLRYLPRDPPPMRACIANKSRSTANTILTGWHLHKSVIRRPTIVALVRVLGVMGPRDRLPCRCLCVRPSTWGLNIIWVGRFELDELAVVMHPQRPAAKGLGCN